MSPLRVFVAFFYETKFIFCLNHSSIEKHCLWHKSLQARDVFTIKLLHTSIDIHCVVVFVFLEI